MIVSHFLRPTLIGWRHWVTCLFGMQPHDVANSRVLELGCAGGGNLIPMALTMPDAKFVGVDLSAVQVAQGQKLIADLGLTNIRLLVLSITDLDESSANLITFFLMVCIPGCRMRYKRKC